MITETEIEKLEAKNFMLGRVTAIEELARKYKTKSGNAFSLGQNKAADILLEIAEEIGADAKSERAEFNKLYHGKVA